MGDLVMRISVFVQRGFICQRCGIEIDGEMSGHPRSCCQCLELDSAGSTESADCESTSSRMVRQLAARP